jgi:hypothetical protein
LAEHGIAPRRGGDRDPESQAFIESWFASKQRCIWREEFEILDEARHVIGNYVERYHHRPPPGPSPTAPRPTSPIPGRINKTSQSQRHNRQTAAGSTPQAKNGRRQDHLE